MGFAIALGAAVAAACFLVPAPSTAQPEPKRVRLVEPRPGQVHNARPARLAGHAVVNFAKLAREQELRGPSRIQARVRIPSGSEEEPEEPLSVLSPEGAEKPSSAFDASPSPSATFMGLDDIPMVDSSDVSIPPDTGGAVGLTKLMSGLNNNYRVFNKSDGTVLGTVGTATFWAPSGETALNDLGDPRTLYDPINNRWIAVMQTSTSNNGSILIGVSETSDPSGNWFLYRFYIGVTIDFPVVGFNKNWIVVAINRYGAAGFQRGLTLVVDYPLARAGAGSGVVFTQDTNTHFTSAPCATYSATSETLYVVTHLTSSAATYALDTITGTASEPVYTAGGAQTRPGGGWVQPGGQLLPQSGPNSGASVCGSVACRIETQDAQVRSAPVDRDGFIYYTQTIGLPAGGLMHTGVQWTKLNIPSGSFADGGRIEDPTATATNGAPWYAYPHIAVNSVGDFMVGYSQFSSAQHPSAGYSIHLAADAPGTIRDPVIYKVGEDYYHKDFGFARNRWGDFSQAQVDPSDDRSLWTVQEYGKTRASTDDSPTRANGSRWSTYWANVAGPEPTVTIAPGPSESEGNGGFTAFTFTVNLSTGYSLPVTVDYQASDGTATVADNDYETAAGSIIIPAGEASGTITIDVVGDTNAEDDETFGVALTSATNAMIGSPSGATGTVLNDDNFTISASAEPGGSIDPSGAVSVAPGADQSFAILPDGGLTIANVLVDATSAGAIDAYTFTNVTANHTITASFLADPEITIGDFVAAEGNSGTTDFTFPVRLSRQETMRVDVTWQTEDVTAEASSGDYEADSNVISFDPGVTSAIISIHVAGDLTPEGQETFLVNLSNAVHATIGDSHGLGMILNDDGASAVESPPPADLSFAIEGGNPNGEAVRFRLGLPASASVELTIYDVAGRRVGQPLDGILPAGTHRVGWNYQRGGAGVASGVYFARFAAEGRTFTRRFVLLR